MFFVFSVFFVTDTGSQVSALPIRFVPKHFKKKTLLFNLLSANESQVNTYGHLKHTVSIGDQNFTYEFVVADVQNIVLGMDFFRTFGWINDPKENTITCNQIKIPCHSSDKPSLSLHTISTPDTIIQQLKDKFKSLFDINEYPTTVKNHKVEHRISLKQNAVPSEQELVYHYSPEVQDKIVKYFEDLEARGICRRSDSAWSSPIIVVDKKNRNETRCAIDYRYINKHTLNDSYSLPNMNSFNNLFAGSTVFSVIDID